jgi:hypothetical protein
VDKEDLVFNILARDRSAKKTFKSIGDAAEHAGEQIGRLSKAAVALGSAGALGGVAAGGLLIQASAATTAAAAMGTLKLAIGGVSDAFKAGDDAEAYSEAMAKLAPAARDFVREARGVGDELGVLRGNLQGEFFEPLAGGLQKLTHAYIPVLAEQVPALARSLGEAARSWIDVVSSSANVARVGRIVESAARSTTEMGVAAGSVTTAVLRLGDAGSPTMERLSRDIARASTSFDRFVMRAQADGSLDRVFTMAADAVEGLGHALAPLGESLYRLFSGEGAAQGLHELVSILGVASYTVSTLVNAFASLPDGMQAALIAFGAMGMTISRLYSAGTAAAGWLEKLGGSLEQLGPTGGIAAKGLNAAAVWAGRATIALAGLQVLNVVGQAFATAAPSVDEMTKSLRGLATVGAKGADLSGLARDLTMIKNIGGADGLRKALAIEPGAMRFFDSSIASISDRIKSYDQALSEMVQRGDSDQARKAFEEIGAAAQEQGISVGMVRGLLPGYAAALESAATGAGASAKATLEADRAQRILNGSLDQAVGQLGSLAAAFDLINGKFLGFREAEIAAEDATSRLKDAMEQSGASLDENTEAGRAAEKSLIDMAKASAMAAQKKYEEAGSIRAASAVFAEHRLKAIEVMTALGMTRQAAEALADRYMKMPALTINYKSVSDAQWAIMSLQERINALPTYKAIHIQTFNNQVNRIDRLDPNARADGGIDLKMANGGITSRWLRSPTILAGERGSEAYISMSAPRQRSRAIARQAVDMLGGPESIWGGRGSTYNLGGITVVAPPGASMSQVGQMVGAEVIKAIKTYEQQNGTGWRS